MIKTIELKEYRTGFANSLLVVMIGIAISFLLVRNGVNYRNSSEGPLLKNILLFGMIGLAAFYTNFIKKQKEKLRRFDNFQVKSKFHQRYYKMKMKWHVLSGIVSSILYVLVANKFFFYFSIIDLILLAISFPNKIVFQKELQDPDIIFI